MPNLSASGMPSCTHVDGGAEIERLDLTPTK